MSPTIERPWAVLLEGPKDRGFPKGVANSGGRYETEKDAIRVASRLSKFGFKNATVVFRPDGVNLSNEELV